MAGRRTDETGGRGIAEKKSESRLGRIDQARVGARQRAGQRSCRGGRRRRRRRAVLPTVASDPELGQVRRRKYTPPRCRSIDAPHYPPCDRARYVADG